MGMRDQLKVYLAGPIQGCTDEEAKGWRDRFVSEVDDVAFFDPMRRDYRGTETANYNQLVMRDQEEIILSDWVVANVWKPSSGTAMEIFYAARFQIPVILIHEPGSQLSPWLRFYATYIVDSIDEAIAIIRDAVEERQ